MAYTSYTASALADLSYALLDFYVRGKAFSQTTQDKPLLAWLKENQETFPGGKQYISSPVQGAYMSDTAGFVDGYSDFDDLTFNHPSNLLRTNYTWAEVHMGLGLSHSELKHDGISVSDSGGTTVHSKADMVQLTSLFKNRLDDFGESCSRGMNNMLWADGTADAKHCVGLSGLISPTADPAVGTTGGLDRATYTWWRHRRSLAIATSPTNQTLTKTLRAELRQLRRYGGKPTFLPSGSAFIEALESEVFEKGIYPQEGFTNQGKNDIGMAAIKMQGVGTFIYDPTMDDLGLSKYCYFLDPRRIKLRPMEGEDMKVLKPTRPYNIMVFLQSVTWTGGMEATQLNACGVFSVA